MVLKTLAVKSVTVQKSVTVHSILKSLRLPERQTWGALAPSQERATPLCLENHSPLLLVSLEVRNKLLSPASGESRYDELPIKIYSIIYDFILDIGIVLY